MRRRTKSGAANEMPPTDGPIEDPLAVARATLTEVASDPGASTSDRISAATALARLESDQAPRTALRVAAGALRAPGLPRDRARHLRAAAAIPAHSLTALEEIDDRVVTRQIQKDAALAALDRVIPAILRRAPSSALARRITEDVAKANASRNLIGAGSGDPLPGRPLRPSDICDVGESLNQYAKETPFPQD